MPALRQGLGADVAAKTPAQAARAGAQPPALTLRSRDAGYFTNFSAGRTGRRTNSPPQLGQRPPSTVSAQLRQNVHSNEQITASTDSGGRSRSQHSQFGRSWSIFSS
jgi:hypothetical protein